MPYDKKYNKTRMKYAKECMHTIALAYKNEDYEVIKAVADEEGKPVARFVKDAVDLYLRLKREVSK